MTDNNWYWKKGLHDAEVIDVKKTDLNYDYTQKNPVRNKLEIFLDSRNALFDSSIKSICFYNYKILKGDEDILHTWWFNDELIEAERKKQLKINLRRSKNEFCEMIISFESAEVKR